MHLILPLIKKDRESFRSSALAIGFDEFVVHKFLFTLQDSDLDIFPLMHDERMSLLTYGWEICEIFMQNDRNTNMSESYYPPQAVQIVMKWLARYSIDLWLSKEWENCSVQMRTGLVYCLQRVKDILLKAHRVRLLNWREMLKWNIHPWDQKYVSKFFQMKNTHPTQFSKKSIEDIELPATNEDMDYLREEDILIILIRLIKMLDAFCLEGAKQLAMRVIAAWNAIYKRAQEIPGNQFPNIPEDYKKCIITICHVYLMTVYEMDDNQGFIIDNMMNNIRFYHQVFQEKRYKNPFDVIAMLNFTPARFIALTCINLHVSIDEFFEIFTCQSVEKNFCSLSGVISQSYVSYILGNQLMEINSMNEENFNAHQERYKHLFYSYLEERESSEKFFGELLKKQELQRNGHYVSRAENILTDIESKFCKGNRSSNIGSCDDNIHDAAESPYVSGKKTDSIFQNIPNNEEILNHVYRMLAKRTFDGWHFAKIILLLKIIGNEVNSIETWRYHPGLTTDFMLSLEIKLSKHFEDLAIIFQEHFFLEQEFWLTAFYLNPIRKYYGAVIRCGMRYQRRLNHVDNTEENDKSDKCEKNSDKNCLNAKYGLLSSTIDVTEIVNIANHDMGHADYDALNKVLADLKLPEQTIKDLLTVTFLARNKNYAWAVNWAELRKRCKKLLKYPEQKRSLVELNMAEANDRLKYLHIDYDKYKHRPQLDYGRIEEGYENVLNCKEPVSDSDDNDDDSDLDVSLDDIKKGYRSDNNDDLSPDELEQLADIYITGTRRTRARTAAAIATARMTDKIRIEEKEVETNEEAGILDDQTQNNVGDLSNIEIQSCTAKRKLSELLQERPLYRNETPGFKPFPDIWDIEGEITQSVDKSSMVLPELDILLQKFSTLKRLKGSNICDETLHRSDDSEPNDSLGGVLTFKKQPLSDDESTLSAEEFVINGRVPTENSANIFRSAYASNVDQSLNSRSSLVIEPEYTTFSRDDGNTEEETVIDVRDIFNIKYIQNNENFPESKDQEDELNTMCSENVGSEEKPRIVKEGESSVNPGTLTENTMDLKKDTEKIEDLNKENPHTEFLQRKVLVRIKKLKVSDFCQLRQPCVRIKRMNCESSLRQRRKQKSRQAENYDVVDDHSRSSSSSHTPVFREYIRGLYKRPLSQMSSTSTASEDESPAEVNTSRSQTATRFISTGPSRTRQKKLMITPRSASGLKMRISSAPAAPRENNIELIQISSSELEVSEESETGNDLNPLSYANSRLRGRPTSINQEEDPLYEEEVIFCD